MRVALVQMNSGEDKPRNIKKALDFVRGAFSRKARFVLLPEYFYFRGRISGPVPLKDIVEPVEGPTSRLFSELARRFRGYVLLGSIYEQIPGQDKAYNTSVLIGPTGKVLAVYRKKHLFHIRLPRKEVYEGRIFQAGASVKVFPVGEFTLGMSVCFDVRFPRVYEDYFHRGANVFSVPSAFARTTGETHWEVLLRARAIETLSYVLAPDQAGVNADGSPYWGNSMVVDPWGRIIGQASRDREELVFAEINIAAVRKARSIFPNYKQFK